jgi:hypothetical protein
MLYFYSLELKYIEKKKSTEICRCYFMSQNRSFGRFLFSLMLKKMRKILQSLSIVIRPNVIWSVQNNNEDVYSPESKDIGNVYT